MGTICDVQLFVGVQNKSNLSLVKKYFFKRTVKNMTIVKSISPKAAAIQHRLCSDAATTHLSGKHISNSNLSCQRIRVVFSGFKL